MVGKWGQRRKAALRAAKHGRGLRRRRILRIHRVDVAGEIPHVKQRGVSCDAPLFQVALHNGWLCSRISLIVRGRYYENQPDNKQAYHQRYNQVGDADEERLLPCPREPDEIQNNSNQGLGQSKNQQIF